MSLDVLIGIVEEICGPDGAAEFERRAIEALPGVHVYIRCRYRRTLDRADVDGVAPGRPQEAARRLGVHPSTVYRALRRRPMVR